MGKMAFVICSGVSELERSIIIERVKLGLKRAKANGVRLGRPKINLDLVKVQRLRAQGRSLRDIARETHASFGVVARAVKTL